MVCSIHLSLVILAWPIKVSPLATCSKKRKKCHLNILPFIVMKGFFQHQHFYFLILSNCHELYELYELVKVDIILWKESTYAAFLKIFILIIFFNEKLILNIYYNYFRTNRQGQILPFVVQPLCICKKKLNCMFKTVNFSKCLLICLMSMSNTNVR